MRMSPSATEGKEKLTRDLTGYLLRRDDCHWTRRKAGQFG